MPYDAALVTPLGMLALSAGASVGAYWARSRDTPRRLLFIALGWIVASLALWALTVTQLDWAWQHVSELLTFHAMSSVLPASVAFAIARRAADSVQRVRVTTAVVVVALLWAILAFPSAVFASCMLDPRCP